MPTVPLSKDRFRSYSPKHNPLLFPSLLSKLNTLLPSLTPSLHGSSSSTVGVVGSHFVVLSHYRYQCPTRAFCFYRFEPETSSSCSLSIFFRHGRSLSWYFSLSLSRLFSSTFSCRAVLFLHLMLKMWKRWNFCSTNPCKLDFFLPNGRQIGASW